MRAAAVAGWLGLASGCGHANVPCPTPTTELDRHREESLAAQRDASRAAAEHRALKEKRDLAERRAAAAAATLDSLARARGETSGR